MKRSIGLSAIIFLISSQTISAQLTDQQRSALNVYIESTPWLLKYEKGVREKVINDPATGENIKSCWENLKKYAVFENIRNMQDLSEIYSELGQAVPELRDKFLPDFKKLDYKNTMTVLPGNTLKIDPGKHAALINRYAAGRHDRLDPENDFGSMIVQYPELVEQLRSAAKATNSKVSDDLLGLWLEMNYYLKMRKDAIKLITEEEKTVRQVLDDGCLSSLPKRFEETLTKEDNTPQNWTGIFGNENISLKFEPYGGSYFATSDKHLGSATESSQWNLTVTGSRAEGDWTVTYTDNDKTVKRSGTIKLKLDGDTMTFDMLGTDWSLQWKPDVKPYEIYETAATTKGVRMTGTLKRK